jgi:hypothetical protein
MQTPLFESKQGFRAYGVVVASYLPEGACHNSSTVYLAEPGGTFRVVLQQAPELLPDDNLYDGNGIGNIEWSPSGSRFLVEISQWTWGTDGDAYTKYILINAADASVRELSIPAAIRRYFAQPCARLIESKGWLDDGRRITIELMPAQDVDEDGAPDPTPSFLRALQAQFPLVSTLVQIADGRRLECSGERPPLSLIGSYLSSIQAHSECRVGPQVCCNFLCSRLIDTDLVSQQRWVVRLETASNVGPVERQGRLSQSNSS